MQPVANITVATYSINENNSRPHWSTDQAQKTTPTHLNHTAAWSEPTLCHDHPLQFCTSYIKSELSYNFPTNKYHSSALTLLVGQQEGHPEWKKNRVVGCWCGCLFGARCRLAYGPANATATHCVCVCVNSGIKCTKTVHNVYSIHDWSPSAASTSTLRFLVGVIPAELQEQLDEASLFWWCLRTFTVSDHSFCSDSHVSNLLQTNRICASARKIVNTKVFYPTKTFPNCATKKNKMVSESE